ncbi:exoribonuclease R [Rubidibacter lacunae KORDI 51-2]|uniref:Exoribonuclease R n=1 Tax=Rubidibacter lacunae KORDI 51-2 TaxID=582515 RepID=U5DMQ1_9CHRO|nr:ribonuclease R family protein [Rubidibacter lacunae]ERN40980.1 exoribonuclease R [Rubidibacter lacunae KORDI 51-2]
MQKGSLVEFRVRGERRLAVVERPEGKKQWVAIDERGQSHTLHPRQVEYEVEGGPQHAAEIETFLTQVEPYLEPSHLEVAWELLSETGEAVGPSELAVLLFSSQEPEQCYAAHVLLADDKFYFKRKGETYEPRSSAQVTELKHQSAVEAQRRCEKAEFQERIRGALAGELVGWTDSDRARFDALARFALHPEQDVRVARETLSDVERAPTPQGALQLLVDLRVWSEHENLFLHRSAYPQQFPHQVLDVAQQTLATLPTDSDGDRLDLTHLKLYTIDDESTCEIDDGLSVEGLDDGRERIWVHIADPTRLLVPEDALDREARRRSTSLYLPTGTISMFPAELATGPMSLVQGQICPALSFGVILDDDGAIAEYEIHASLVRPTYRLTYDDVDEMLELGLRAEPEIASLAAGAERRRQWRQTQGSIEINMPECVIKVDAEEQIAIQVLDASRARQLVAEMMILAGETAGRFARDREVTMPFRGQPQPELPSEDELLQLPAGPVRDCAVRGCMTRSEMGIVPARHAGLGLDVYVQVTSPIRRYIDLLGHFQLKAHLRGEELPFTAEQVQAITSSAASAAYEAVQVERQTKRYWGLEYLRRHANQPWQALILRWLRPDEKLGILLIEDLGLELPHRFQLDVNLGDRVEVEVIAADPRQDLIRFRERVPETEPAATAG